MLIDQSDIVFFVLMGSFTLSVALFAYVAFLYPLLARTFRHRSVSAVLDWSAVSALGLAGVLVFFGFVATLVVLSMP